jgi:hypothetical protein
MSIREAARRHRQRKTTHAQRKRTTDEHDEHDVLIPDHVFAEELGGVSRMTIHRWDRDPRMIELGFPARVMLNGRGYRSRQQTEKFKTALLRKAIAARGGAAT